MDVIIKKIENSKQKLIITYLIVSDKFIEELFPILQEHKKIIYQSFTGFYKTVLTWCFEYYQRYNKAPNTHIQNIYNENKLQLQQEEQELLSEFLQNLSDKYQDTNYNEKYVFDLAMKYLREVNLDVLQKEMNTLKSQGKIDEAENLLLTYTRFDTQTDVKQETQLFKDIETAVKICDFETNQNEDDRLFKLRGEIGDKLNWIYREDFFSLNGATKIGKSFYLREIALICVDYGLNVLIFNLEMSHAKYLRNFYQNISQEIKNKPEDFENIRIPYFEEGNGKYDIRYEEIKKFGLNGRKIKGVFRKKQIKTKGDILLRSFPSNTLTFQKLNKCLEDYALNGFVVDVVLIDFLDNLQDFSKKDFRHTINEKWVGTRKLAQEKHIAVGTVSHTNKKTFTKDIAKGDSVEDIRKEAHVTHMIGLNQNSKDKTNQIMRLNIIHSRDEDSNEKEMFLSLECRSIGKVLIDNKSIFKVNYSTDKEN